VAGWKYETRALALAHSGILRHNPAVRFSRFCWRNKPPIQPQSEPSNYPFVLEENYT
jgi:hypothetical protein